MMKTKYASAGILRNLLVCLKTVRQSVVGVLLIAFSSALIPACGFGGPLTFKMQTDDNHKMKAVYVRKIDSGGNASMTMNGYRPPTDYLDSNGLFTLFDRYVGGTTLSGVSQFVKYLDTSAQRYEFWAVDANDNVILGTNSYTGAEVFSNCAAYESAEQETPDQGFWEPCPYVPPVSIAIAVTSAQQRYPWNGLVDIGYQVTGLDASKNYGAMFSVGVGGVTNSFTVADITAGVDGEGNGTLVWDAAAANAFGTSLTNATASITASLYCTDPYEPEPVVDPVCEIVGSDMDGETYTSVQAALDALPTTDGNNGVVGIKLLVDCSEESVDLSNCTQEFLMYAKDPNNPGNIWGWIPTNIVSPSHYAQNWHSETAMCDYFGQFEFDDGTIVQGEGLFWYHYGIALVATNSTGGVGSLGDNVVRCGSIQEAVDFVTNLQLEKTVIWLTACSENSDDMEAEAGEIAFYVFNRQDSSAGLVKIEGPEGWLYHCTDPEDENYYVYEQYTCPTVYPTVYLMPCTQTGYGEWPLMVTNNSGAYVSCGAARPDNTGVSIFEEWAYNTGYGSQAYSGQNGYLKTIARHLPYGIKNVLNVYFDTSKSDAAYQDWYLDLRLSSNKKLPANLFALAGLGLEPGLGMSSLEFPMELPKDLNVSLLLSTNEVGVGHNNCFTDYCGSSSTSLQCPSLQLGVKLFPVEGYDYDELSSACLTLQFVLVNPDDKSDEVVLPCKFLTDPESTPVDMEDGLQYPLSSADMFGSDLDVYLR